MFSSIPPVARNGEGRNRKSQQINIWCCRQDFDIFFKSGVILHDTRRADNRQGTPVSKEEKDFCVGVSRAH